jgi:5-methylcytosine-specific restriction endonuclease McrA
MTKEKIKEIRCLLDELEEEQPSEEDAALLKNFSAFEIPEIICEIVDYLMPLLDPYEATIYWYAFRHSILSTGEQYVRLSTRKLQSGVISSASGQSTDIALNTVIGKLKALETKGALRKEGEPNRDGTLYKVMLPEEIDVCRQLMQEKQKKEPSSIDVKKEADFYNVKENRQKIYERDGYKCDYCNKLLTRFTATLDHVKPVAEGGDNSYDNLVTACRECNSKKQKKLLGDFLADTN